MTRVATIAKRFDFHAAHRLPHHNGQCRDLHGHTYQLEVSVTGPIRRVDGASDEGMVVDFGVIKDLYKGSIEPLVEHKFLNETLEGLVPSSDGVPVTTAEHMAVWMHSLFSDELKLIIDGPRGTSALPRTTVQVTLWETPTSFAQVGPPPWRDR